MADLWLTCGPSHKNFFTARRSTVDTGRSSRSACATSSLQVSLASLTLRVSVNFIAAILWPIVAQRKKKVRSCEKIILGHIVPEKEPDMNVTEELKFRSTPEMKSEIDAQVAAHPAPFNRSDFIRRAVEWYLADLRKEKEPSGKAHAPQGATDAHTSGPYFARRKQKKINP